MRILFYDIESFYSDEYSLSKMTRTEYLSDPRFKAHGMAVSIDGERDEWIPGKHLRDFWGDMESHIDAICCHNTLFDHGITAKYYSKKRFFLLDTMSMAQAALAFRYPGLSMSLAALARHYWPDDSSMWKFEGAYGLDPSKGMRDLPVDVEAQLATYAKQDNRVMRFLFQKLLTEDFPWSTEMYNIHITLAMGVYPVLHMDNILAARINARETKEKLEACAKVGVTRADLRSANKFAAILRSQGVEPPTKLSAKTGKEAYAFASKDPGMVALLEHDDPTIAGLAAARVGEKAAQLESRAATFARLPSPSPVPMQAYAAHTGRHGGREFNLQNLKRGSELRACIKAPRGKTLLVADLSQIELRMNAWWCGETWLLEALRTGADVYCELATKIFGRTITKADEFERFIGKTGELSCGYGSGWAKVLSALKAMKVNADEALARNIVKSYRSSHPANRTVWAILNDRAIPAMAGQWQGFEFNGVRFEKGRAVLPSGRSLWYNDLGVNEEGDWEYTSRGKGRTPQRVRIFGAKLLENLIQAMSFDVFMFHARQMDTEGLPPAMCVHDEIMLVVDENEADRIKGRVLEIQSTAPAWCSGIPLKGEANYGTTYLEAK